MPEESPSRDVLNGFAHPPVGGNLIRSVKMVYPLVRPTPRHESMRSLDSP